MVESQAELAATDAPESKEKHEANFREVTLTVGEQELKFRIRDNPNGSILFCLGVRKSGSTLLNKMIIALAHMNSVMPVDVPGTFFKRGYTVRDWRALNIKPLLLPGNVYMGFRNFPQNLKPIQEFKDSRKIFMFRDPRDALVSQYFSDAYSHSLPQAGSPGRELFIKKRQEALDTPIDDWVLANAAALRQTLLQYKDLLNDKNCLLLRYEDYVFQKRRLAHKIMQHFGWTASYVQIDGLLADVDMVPDAEDKKRFVRKAIPGDHIAKLHSDTIQKLNHRMGDVMQLFDYY